MYVSNKKEKAISCKLSQSVPTTFDGDSSCLLDFMKGFAFGPL